MAPHSILLIDEKVLPSETSEESDQYSTELSLTMFALFKSLERNEVQYEHLDQLRENYANLLVQVEKAA
jgi:hypothetical protein